MLLAPNISQETLSKYITLLRTERDRRAFTAIAEEASPHDWARGFNGKPREFIGEIVGKSWYGEDWTAWRAFVATLFGQKLTAKELPFYQKCTGLTAEPTATPKREAWVPVGRRGGKSRVLALLAAYLATAPDWTPYLAPGERGYIVVLAAQRKQAGAIMGYVKAALLGHPKLKPLISNMLAESVELLGNVTIEVVTASISAVRSRTVLCALCDEIAFWRSEESSANPDAEILAALRPAMATIPNSMLLAASSPYARRGVLWDMYERCYGKVESPLVWQAPTRVMHPSISQGFIDEEYAKDPIAAAAEYGAEFRSDVDAYVSREAARDAVMSGRYELPYLVGVRYHAFVDPSGGSSDAMTLAVAHRDPKTGRGVLDCLRERRPPFSPEDVVEEFAGVIKSYKVASVVGDRYAGEWPRERFRLQGVNYECSERTKVDLYREFLPMLNAGRVEMLDVPRMFDQLVSLERRTARGGRDSIDHPPGGHDDMINSAAGALVIAAGGAGPMIVPREVLERARMLGAR